ncbi:MAG: hypothetical protein HQK86_09125 [Nitrospinae bacterium]|nr:hypothetical protein [Nitrospinota bacterium]MBF0633498.1 hypothetical protein [Nitrospinota bacterium]
MFYLRLIVILVLSALVLGSKTGSASPAEPLLNPADVICGLPHNAAPQQPAAEKADTVSLASFEETLWKEAVQFVKSHGSHCPLHAKPIGHDDCPMDKAGICCPTGSGEGAVDGQIIDLLALVSCDAVDVSDAASIAFSQNTLHNSHLTEPHTRPPAA